MNSHEKHANELGIDHRISADRSARKYRIRDIVFHGRAHICTRTCVRSLCFPQSRESFLRDIERGKGQPTYGPSHRLIPRRA